MGSNAHALNMSFFRFNKEKIQCSMPLLKFANRGQASSCRNEPPDSANALCRRKEVFLLH